MGNPNMHQSLWAEANPFRPHGPTQTLLSRCNPDHFYNASGILRLRLLIPLFQGYKVTIEKNFRDRFVLNLELVVT